MTKQRHFIIHKPYGFLSQFVHNERKRRNRKLLGELHDFPEGTMSIGRLDQDSEGLLLLTTDGKVSNQVLSKKVEKEYYIQVDGIITDEAIEEIKMGVDIALQGETYETLPCKAALFDPAPDFAARSLEIRVDRHGPTSWMSVTVNEGKFRQVRKMSAAVGFPTLRLVRVRIGDIYLNNMKSGEVVEVDDFKLW